MNGEFETDRYKPGSFGCHEALHLTSVLAGLVEEQLVNHPAVQMSQQWRLKAEKAACLLHELYQDIGSKHLET